MKLNLDDVKTTDDVRYFLDNPRELLEEFHRIIFFPQDLGKPVHSKVVEEGDWYTSYFDVYRMDMSDGVIYVGAGYDTGNTENQDDDEVSEYDEIFEVVPKEKVVVEYVPVSWI